MDRADVKHDFAIDRIDSETWQKHAVLEGVHTPENTQEPSMLDETSKEWFTKLKKLGVYTPEMLETAFKFQKTTSFLVDGLIRDKSVNLLVGDSGLGKTPLAIQLGICVASGKDFLGRKVKEGRVLYCDAESDLAGFNSIQTAISGFLGLSKPPSEFLVWSPNWDEGKHSGEVGWSWSKKLETRVYDLNLP
jgi:RecA-family ATPase